MDTYDLLVLQMAQKAWNLMSSLDFNGSRGMSLSWEMKKLEAQLHNCMLAECKTVGGTVLHWSSRVATKIKQKYGEEMEWRVDYRTDDCEEADQFFLYPTNREYEAEMPDVAPAPAPIKIRRG